MLTRRNAGVSFVPLAMGVALFGLTGCGIGVGDHVFYRVAVDATARDVGCYGGNPIPDSIRDDKIVNLAGSNTFILYIAGDKEPELDTGSLVAGGAETDTGYRFTGQVIDVEYHQMNMIKVTQTQSLTVIMNIDGPTVSGTAKNVIVEKCEGTNCAGNFNNTTCTETNVFKGVEMDQAEVVVGNSPAPKP